VNLVLPNAKPVSAPAIVRASSYWSPRRMVKEFLSPDRKAGQTMGTHIDNLVQCRRVITLSPEEARKFTQPRGRSIAERNNYAMKRSMPVAQAWCDATGQYHPGCLVFFPKELT
jgi:hypothetical protein